MRNSDIDLFFRPIQLKIINRRALAWFEKPEDRDDFRQTVFTIALENWIEQGRPMYDGKPDIYRVDYLVLMARGLLLKSQRGITESRAGDVLLSEAQIEGDWFNLRAHRSLGHLLDRCVPTNSKDRIGKQSYRFIADNGMKVYLTYDEIQQFTRCTRNSIGRLRRLNRKIKTYVWEDGKIYPSIKRIQDEHGVTEAKARWGSKQMNFSWDESIADS